MDKRLYLLYLCRVIKDNQSQIKFNENDSRNIRYIKKPYNNKVR